MFRSIVISITAFLSCPALFAQATNHVAPGAPGLAAHWPSAAKNGFATANTLASKVWFTLNNGVMTEVFYPTLDVPNVQTLQLLNVAGSMVVSFANDGMMIPEQVWDRNHSPPPELRFGEVTGSATPLAWSMAQFIRLATNLEQGRNVETPALSHARNWKGLVNN